MIGKLTFHNGKFANQIATMNDQGVWESDNSELAAFLNAGYTKSGAPACMPQRPCAVMEAGRKLQATAELDPRFENFSHVEPGTIS